jgi:hypothetical protein
MSSIASRIKGVFDLPSYVITEERTNEIIEKWVKTINRLDLETIAILFSSSLMPISGIVSQIFLIPASLFLDLLGLKSDDYVAFLNNPQSLKRLVERLVETKNVKEGSKPEDTALKGGPWNKKDNA